MTPDGAVRLIELYARAQEALARDAIDETGPILAEADALIAEPLPAGTDPAMMRALAEQAEQARSDAAAALAAARERLMREAQRELRPGGGAAGAYAQSHERPAARFIDRTG